MRIRGGLGIFLLFFFSGLNAQHPAAQPDSLSIYRLLDQAEQCYARVQYDSALFFTNKAVNLARSARLYRAEGWALVKTGEIQVEARMLDQAAETSKQLNKIAKQLNDSLLGGISVLHYGQVKMYQEELNDAIILIDKSIKAGLGNYPNQYLALAFNDLGYSWGMMGEYEKQAEFTHKALTIYESLDDDAGIGMTLGNLSTVYNAIGNNEKAIEYGKRSLVYREKTGDIGRLSLTCCNLSQYYLKVNVDEAVRYQQLCVKYANQTGNPKRIIQSYIVSSLVANARKDNKTAFEYELKVIDMLERSGTDHRMLARRYIAAAIYNNMLKLDSAVTLGYYNKSIQLARDLGDRHTLRDVYLHLHNFHNSRKNYSDALIAFKKHVSYSDSLINLEKEERIAQLEKQYESSRKDNEIERLSNEQTIKQLEIEKQRAIIAGNAAMALQKQNEIDLLSKSKELQDVELKRQGEEIQKQQLIAKTQVQQLELTEKENQLRQKQLKNQKQVRNLLIGGLVLVGLLGFTYINRYQLKKKLEQEKNLQAVRNNISRDLHDDIGASLSNINILNEMAKRNREDPEKAKLYLDKASEDIQRISESLSDIVWNINPRYDDAQQLFIRMKRYAADMLDGKGIKGEFDFPVDDHAMRVGMERRRDLYLIFKEAVNNLSKYSKAKQAWIGLVVKGSLVELRVKDDGMGFQPGTIVNGNGLQNMMQRAKASGGELEIVSQPGKGTEIRLQLPLS